ncbi:MAG: molybdopterin-synthase adenylyltransferase MoeB [Sideroxydans sp.]|nr:molybdopterin-synthase adenylyltransferase MoeB [Sideroxydans sp.]MDD5471376.1 molybdopterin-synthase adenylyltransferase MoeB [Sideroxydans sp.]
MDDNQLLRYSRHILLPEIGIEGQQSFLDARVLILGAGGLGSPAAMFLAASGVGSLTLCDDDKVDLTNLQRQLAHRTASIGVAKVQSAQQTLHAINPEVRIQTVQERADETRLNSLVSEADIVLDCSDNFPTRYALNRVCAVAGKPLVSGAATRFDGQVGVFDFRVQNSPCYNCLYPEDSEAEETRCAVMGVFAPLVGIVGSMQAAEALKLLAGIESTLHGRLLTLDALTMQPRVMKLARDPQCAVCAGST